MKQGAWLWSGYSINNVVKLVTVGGKNSDLYMNPLSIAQRLYPPLLNFCNMSTNHLAPNINLVEEKLTDILQFGSMTPRTSYVSKFSIRSWIPTPTYKHFIKLTWIWIRILESFGGFQVKIKDPEIIKSPIFSQQNSEGVFTFLVIGSELSQPIREFG